MKKFYGLKMAFAVLVAGAAFVSCSDSDAGDIFIPSTPSGGSVVINYPAAIYVVNGVVTDAATSTAIEGVSVSGAVTATTDANGYFTSGTKSAPINGVVSFAKDGYTTVNRTVVMAEATTGTVSEAMNVVMSSPEEAPVGTIVALDPTVAPTPVVDEAVVIEGEALASLVNESDEDKILLVDVSDKKLPYGAIVPAERGFLEDLVREFVMYRWGNDPYVGYSVYVGKLAVSVPARAKAESLTVVPMTLMYRAIFEIDNVVLEQQIEVIDQYGATAEYVPVDIHSEGNGGGGSAGDN
jgi:hypothetical protein